ncbi:UNVERIFIED_ORG: hypothetical protein GGE64_000323 [Rhizobium etli]|nr:esterase family domain-containing protein [Rhizobium sp. Kim5]
MSGITCDTDQAGAGLLNGALLEDGVLRNAARLAGIPGILLQGRFDIEAPLVTAWDWRAPGQKVSSGFSRRLPLRPQILI